MTATTRELAELCGGPSFSRSITASTARSLYGGNLSFLEREFEIEPDLIARSEVGQVQRTLLLDSLGVTIIFS